MVMKSLGGLAADWARDVWAVAARGDEDRVGGGMAAIANGLPEDEAFELAREWYGRATKADFPRGFVITVPRGPKQKGSSNY